MADKKHNDKIESSSEPRNHGIEFERRDVSVGAVIKFVVILALGIGLSMILMRGLFSLLDARENAEKGEPISQVEGDHKQLPPEPRIQGIPDLDFHKNSPARDMEMYLDQEQRRLGTKVQTDEHGKVEPAPFEPVVTDPANKYYDSDRSSNEGHTPEWF